MSDSDNHFSPSRRAVLRALAAGAAVAALPGGSRPVLAKKSLTIGFIYVGPRDDFGYNQAHAQAAAQIKKLAGVSVIEEEKVPETVAVQKAMAGMIAEDEASLIFPTSFGYFDPHVLKMAEKYPEVRFAHCGGLWRSDKHPKNVGSFFGYIDECQFLNGIAAAHASKTKKLGFIAAKPIPQVLRNINAFALGAQSVDPACTTRVIFTGDWSLPVREAEAANSLIDQGVDVLTCHVDSPKVCVETAERRGIYTCGYHASQARLAPRGYLTGAEWNWVTPYTELVKAAQNGAPMPNFLRGGLKEGYVKMSEFGKALAEPGRKNVTAVKDRMLKGEYVIFKGPLKDNTGKDIVPAGAERKQSDPVLEEMNYLVAGVIGQI